MTKFEKQFIRMLVDARIRHEEWVEVVKQYPTPQNQAMKDSTFADWCSMYDVLVNSGDRRMMDIYSDALWQKRDQLEAA